MILRETGDMAILKEMSDMSIQLDGGSWLY